MKSSYFSTLSPAQLEVYALYEHLGIHMDNKSFQVNPYLHPHSHPHYSHAHPYLIFTFTFLSSFISLSCPHLHPRYSHAHPYLIFAFIFLSSLISLSCPHLHSCPHSYPYLVLIYIFIPILSIHKITLNIIQLYNLYAVY